jgi:hypothetical protein
MYRRLIADHVPISTPSFSNYNALGAGAFTIPWIANREHLVSRVLSYAQQAHIRR